jgi:large subunit ribosomal protein L32
MAVPKYKTSKARKRTRSAANFKATTQALAECPHCHAVVRPHTVCSNCGYYKGVQRIESQKEKTENKAKAKKDAAAPAPATK